MSYKSLIINPGSTSTKIGVFEDETLLFEETLRHSTEEIAQYATIVDQKDFRKDIILNLLASKDFDINSLVLQKEEVESVRWCTEDEIHSMENNNIFFGTHYESFVRFLNSYIK